MTDIVERLRDADISGHGSYSALVREAADEIERINAARHADSQRMVRMSDEYEAAQNEIERLRAKLADIANSMKRDWQDPADHANWCIEHAKT